MTVLPDGTVVDIPQTGLIGSEQALRGGLQGALGAIAQGTQVARGDIGQTQQIVGQQIGQGVGALDPFAAPGAAAFQRQAALAGAGGPQVQAQAFQQFQESPGQAFLREQGQQALLRGQGAIGGLGGGNVRRELLRQGIGFAQQDFANQFNRLGALSQIGAGAAGQQAGLRGQQAGITSGLGQFGAGLAQRAGEFGGQAFLGTGQQLAAGRTRAGEGIAGAAGTTGSALANLIAGQGQGVSNILGQGTGSLANILAAAGGAGQASQQQLATLLANIATGSASQQAALPGLPGLQRDPGILAGIGQAAGGIGTAIGAFSDIRLKKNITKVGQTKKGINLYIWDWNEIGRKITGQLSGAGVIAQEIRKIMPEAVIDGAYLRVDYGKVF